MNTVKTINVSNKVTNLMRKNYGFSHQKHSLTLRDSDTESQVWRKIARYIYRNACAENPEQPFETTEEQDINFFLGFVWKTYGEHTLAKVEPKEFISLERRLLKKGFKDEAEGLKRAVEHAYFFIPNDSTSHGFKKMLYLFDPENKVANKYSNNPTGRYYWRNSYYRAEVTGLLSRDAFNFLNLEDARGFAQLFRAALKEAHVQAKESDVCGLNRDFYNDPMKYLHSDALHEDAVNEMLSYACEYDPKHNLAIGNMPYRLACGDPKAFCKYSDYVENQKESLVDEEDYMSNFWVVFNDSMNISYTGTYAKCMKKVFWPLQARYFLKKFAEKFVSQAVMLKYQQSQSKKVHAKFFQTKKNINLKTQAEMMRLSKSWNDLFANVEIDNDVDLVDLQKVVPEITSIGDIIPRAKNGAMPILRFRKIRNHKALGIFSPFNNTIAVDFRDNEGGIGLQSFVHEYGHFLDYNNDENGILSLQASFSKILKSAKRAIYASDNLELSTKPEYFSTPTEVFARAFELYCSHCGLNNSLIKEPEVYATDPRFTTFSDECREWIYSYFDAMFPSLKKSIKDKIEYEEMKDNIDAEPKSTGTAKMEYSDEELELLMVHATKVSENAVQLALF